ncbi:MAG: hypothetical protein KAQ92_08565 [Candidatus Aenigmarchaeota archaeon]|nr:hypothetical protein [Candidatus Aenigmarchaeota archaeon]
MKDKSKFFIEKIILKYESSIGSLEFRFIAFKDMEFFRNLDKELSEKDFSIKALFNQLETNLTFDKFSNVRNSELKKIIDAYAKKSKILSEYYSQSNSANIFLKFKKSILAYLEEERKRMELLSESINKQFEPMKKMIEKVTAFSIASPIIAIPKIPVIDIPKIALPDVSSQLKILNNSFFKVFEEQSKRWQNFAVQYEKISKKSLKNLTKYNWFINSSMPASFIAETAKANNSKEMKELFISYHIYDNCKTLDEYYIKWSQKSLFQKRLKILRDAINLFKENYKNQKINIHNIIIPVLINQIEGIKHDYLDNKGIKKLGTNSFQNPVTKKTDKKWYEYYEDILKKEDEFTKLCFHIFKNVLFQQDKDNVSIINFSRHKISHGVIVKYGTFETTIRCFMILEFLSDLK